MQQSKLLRSRTPPPPPKKKEQKHEILPYEGGRFVSSSQRMRVELG